MDIEAVLQSVILIKIRNDDSYNFSLKEIKTFAKTYNMSLEDFCSKILELSNGQTNNLKKGYNDYVKCKKYKEAKQKFLDKKSSSYILKIIKEKIKTDSSKSFSLEELEKLSIKLGVNVNDLATNVLGISKRMLASLKSGEYNSFDSKKYSMQKEIYLNNLNDLILQHILNSKKQNDFSSKFTYNEIAQYSNRFEINVRDFLSGILGLSLYGKWHAKISETDTYISYKYSQFKDEKMQIVGNQILDSFVKERIKRTGSSRFSKKEIEGLSEIYHINIRDFIVYVLGKSEQLYYDFKADRVGKCFSYKYKNRKEEIIASKREKFLEEVNLNVRTYYSWKDLERLSSALDITIYDLVTIVMQKKKATYYNISNNYRNARRTSIGEYKSGPLPENYCQENVQELLTISKIAAASAVSFLQAYGYYCSTYYKDLVQEGYIYLASEGNPIDKDGNFLISDSVYQNYHSSIFYKKAYFKALSNIRIFSKGENTGKAYEVNNMIKGTTDKIFEEDDASMFIEKLSDDEKEIQILTYFSQNMLSNQTLQEACEIFEVNRQYIKKLFTKMKEKITIQERN